MEKDNQGVLWEVFIQVKAGRPFKHVGSLHAYDKEMAMQSARDLYTPEGTKEMGFGLLKQMILFPPSQLMMKPSLTRLMIRYIVILLFIKFLMG